jgi:serine/threonine protein kinase
MATPERVGRFRIERELGRGGMGVVYEAYDEQLERRVALKTIAANVADDENARKRFLREARAAARVHHPNVCHLYEVGDEDELFIAMELLSGESLAERTQKGPLPFDSTRDLGVEILTALQALHDHGIVHRDLKPSNIFLTAHGVKILDFGLAARTATNVLDTEEATHSRLTQDGVLLGTPRYMSPEQFQGLKADHRSDVFAIGSVLFEMATGRPAFPGDNPVEVYHKTMYEPPPAIGGSQSAEELDKIIRRALAKNPKDRYQRAADMADALSRVTSSTTTEAPSVQTVTRLIVLPFRMLRPDPEVDFLAESIPDAITHALTGLGSLTVRSTAAASKLGADSGDLERIAKDADVDVVLTGSLLHGGDRLQAQVQLVQVPDGKVIWSQRPQLAVRDIFQLQDRIVEKIVDSLSLSLTAREQRMLASDVPASPSAYEFFLRGNRLLYPQGVASMDNLLIARDLYSQAVDEDPRYAPAWVRLGRCHWLIGKGADDRDAEIAKAESCFEKALELNPDLALAHNVYALLDIDRGRAVDAMSRLIERARKGTAQPELFAALVQACKFCNLLEAAVAAYERAHALDRNVVTSVYAVYYLLGDYDRALELAPVPYYLDAAILSLRGHEEEAIRTLREREARDLSHFLRRLLAGLRAAIEGNREEVLEHSEATLAQFPDPEAAFLAVRHLAYIGQGRRAVEELHRVLEGGYLCYRSLTAPDSWFDPIRERNDFKELLALARSRYQEALEAYRDAGGEELLGVKPSAMAP